MVSAAKTKAREQAWLDLACKSTKMRRAGIEVRRALPYSSSSDEQQQQQQSSSVSYAVPAVDLRRMGTARRAIALFTVRELFLNAVEAIMDLERLDDARARNSVRAASQ